MVVESIFCTIFIWNIFIYLFNLILFRYIIIYKVYKIYNNSRLSTILYYFIAMYMASICLGLICGTVGFLASHIFVSKIYTMIKLDWRYIILILIMILFIIQ